VQYGMKFMHQMPNLCEKIYTKGFDNRIKFHKVVRVLVQ
jgi:hypothetical protein